MSIENFIANLRKQLAEAKRLRAKAEASAEKSALTRKIHDLENYIYKAERVGLKE